MPCFQVFEPSRKVGAPWSLQAFLYEQNLHTETSEGSLLLKCWIKEHLPITYTAGATSSFVSELRFTYPFLPFQTTTGEGGYPRKMDLSKGMRH